MFHSFSQFLHANALVESCSMSLPSLAVFYLVNYSLSPYHSTLLAYNLLTIQSQSYVTTDVSRPVCLDVKRPLGPRSTSIFLSDTCGFVDVGHPLWREDGSVFYNVQCTIYLHFTCWSTPNYRLFLYRLRTDRIENISSDVLLRRNGYRAVAIEVYCCVTRTTQKTLLP
jgi:hypothetical protein